MDSRTWILGVPLAGWALVHFTILAGLLVLARFLKSPFAPDALLAGTAVAGGGFAIGIVLTCASLIGMRPFCIVCTVLHAINALLVYALHRASGFSGRRQVHRLRSTFAWLFRPRTEISVSERWKLVAFGSVALLAALAYQWVQVESALWEPRRENSDPAALIASYQATPGIDLPLGVEHPQLGPADAPVRLVVFASFLCPSCRRFASTLTALERQFHGRVLVVFMHYPLSTECNPRLSEDMQQGACEVAWAAEAAHRQGRFWDFHDALFATTAPITTRIDQAARQAHLNPSRFAQDLDAAATKDRVAADIELGTRLRIPGTPSIFLNGRLVRSTAGESLAILIRHELGAVDTRANARTPFSMRAGW